MVGVPLSLWGFFRVARSNSPSGARWRRLLGGNERSRNNNAKQLYWFGEERTISGAAAAEFASKRGYHFDASDPTLLNTLKNFSKVPTLLSQKIEHVVRWHEGELPVSLFMYTDGSGDTMTSETMMHVDAAGIRLPPFVIADKTLFLKLVFSGRNIAFDDDPQFSELFYLESGDEKSARDLFTREVRAAFLAAGNCQLESTAAGLLFREPLQTTTAGFEQFTGVSLRLLETLVERWKEVNRFRR